MGQNKSTYIANKYHLPIYAKCDSERMRFETTNLSGELGYELYAKAVVKRTKTKESGPEEEETLNTGEASSTNNQKPANNAEETPSENSIVTTGNSDNNSINDGESQCETKPSPKQTEKTENTRNARTGMEFKAKVKADTKITHNKIDPDFTRILSGHVLRFDVDCSCTRHVYITIKTVIDGKDEFLCQNLARSRNVNVIVDEDGQVADAAKGDYFEPALAKITLSKANQANSLLHR